VDQVCIGQYGKRDYKNSVMTAPADEPDEYRAAHRRRLWFATLGLAGLSSLVLAYVMFSGLFSGQSQGRDNPGSIAAGESQLQRLNNRSVWVVRFHEESDAARTDQEAYIAKASSTPCLTSVNEYCYLDARGIRSGIVVRYVSERPDQVPSSAAWYGGFVDPSNGAIYDRHGRGFKVNPEGSVPFLEPLVPMGQE
jgi:hypothetical protein